MEMTMSTRTVAAGTFKAQCLKLLDEVRDTGETVIVTKRGKPVAMLTPLNDAATKPRETMFGSMAGTFTINGDLLEPDDTEWNYDFPK
jgi:prevent-host-death family protein